MLENWVGYQVEQWCYPQARNSASARLLLIHSTSPLLFHTNSTSWISVISAANTVFHPNTGTPAKNFGHHTFYVEVIYILYPVKNAYVFPTSPCISVKSWNPENILPDTVLAGLLNYGLNQTKITSWFFISQPTSSNRELKHRWQQQQQKHHPKSEFVLIQTFSLNLSNTINDLINARGN